MRKIRILLYISLGILFAVPFLGAQYARNGYIDMYSFSGNDTILPVSNDTTQIKADSLIIPNDSLKLTSDSINISLDSVPADSVIKQEPKEVLDAIVDYNAKDSIVLTADKFGYLYGDANVTYTDIKLKGEQISMDLDSSLVYATFGLDSVGKEFGYPVFSDGGTDYESKTMKYNFKTKKGYITNVVTTQGEGYVVAGRAKKNEDNSFFMREGKYTTCDDHEHPHFYLALTKAKVNPKKNVVTGPAYLVIEDLPLPIGIPFGFFPFSDRYSSGVIMPSYGDEMDRGFNLHDGGYYFAINDNIDLSVTGDIYTKGSWGLKAQSTYRKRYKHSGSFNFNYLVNKYGEKGIDYSVNKDLALNWTHSQDPKANTLRTLSASVNFSTSSYNRNSLDNKYIRQGTSNTKASSVSLTQKIPNSPWSLSASVNVAQRSADSTISLTLPNLMVTMSRIAPFKRKEMVGDEKWYEKIQLSYTGEFRNSIETKENLLFKSNLQKDWRNAMKHTIPVSATFTAFNYLNITPSFNYTERWYTNKIMQSYDSERKTFAPAVGDTTYSFNRVYDFNMALSFQTKMYGFFTPLFSKNTTIRHVFTPSISMSYAPDFSSARFGFYERERYTDEYGNRFEYVYSPYERAMFGSPSKGAQGLISFSFENNLEMKIPSQSDTTGYKKISLIDNLGINFSHNLMADSIKWSDISTNIRLKFSKSLTVNIGAVFDPYLYRYNDYGRVTRVDELRIKNGRGIGRLRSTGYSISPSINQDTFKKWFGRGKDSSDSDNTSDDAILGTDGQFSGDPDDAEAGGSRRSMLEGKQDSNEYDEDGYIKNEIKWNLGFTFSMNYSYDMSRDPIEKKDGYVEYRGRLTKSFNFNGNIQPTRNWNMNFNATYDFDAKKIAYMTVNLTRNLHCWSISANVNPIGNYKSYYISLRASSSLLRDLKYEQRGRTTSYDPNWD